MRRACSLNQRVSNVEWESLYKFLHYEMTVQTHVANVQKVS